MRESLARRIVVRLEEDDELPSRERHEFLPAGVVAEAQAPYRRLCVSVLNDYGGDRVMTAYDYATLLAHANGDWHPGPWGPLMLVLWAAVIGAVVWFLARRRPQERPGPERALDILAERYARGELSAEEYRERREQLR